MQNDENYFNLIHSGGEPGIVNMAKDLYVLNRYRYLDYFTALPTLHLYFFSPPALSLGFFQNTLDNELIKKAKAKRYDIVRRPTGGRAVLHLNEITYSVIAPYKSGFFAGKLIETYKIISDFIYNFFLKIGLNPDAASTFTQKKTKKYFNGSVSNTCDDIKDIKVSKVNNADINKINQANSNIFADKSAYAIVGVNNKEHDKNVFKSTIADTVNKEIVNKNFNCFLKAHSYEITFSGKKICGNSQRRNDAAFLQHGSIYIDYNPEEHYELFENNYGDNENSGAETLGSKLDSKKEYNKVKDYFEKITGIKQELAKSNSQNTKAIDYNKLLDKNRLLNVLTTSFEETYNLKAKDYKFNDTEISQIGRLAESAFIA
ncbi:MAG: lipoate--protein ligase family protein [bacterium]